MEYLKRFYDRLGDDNPPTVTLHILIIGMGILVALIAATFSTPTTPL